ncbi:MAG: hypothetical protein K1W15_14445 [Lachnospiraceae bacterium]
MLKQRKNKDMQPQDKRPRRKQAVLGEEKSVKKSVAGLAGKTAITGLDVPCRLAGYRLAYTVPADTTPKVIAEGVVTMGMPPLVLYSATFRYKDLSYLNNFTRQADSEELPQDYVEGTTKLQSSKVSDDVEVDVL